MKIKRVLRKMSNFVRWNAYEAERKAALKEMQKEQKGREMVK